MLTTLQAAFIEHYVATGNGTQSARLAGYQGSDRTLGVTASRMLGRASIRAALAELPASPPQRVAASLAAAAGSAAWIVDRAVALADGARQDRDKIQALALLARRHAEFRDAGPAVVQQIVALPEGTGLDDLRALAASMRGARALAAPPSEGPQ